MNCVHEPNRIQILALCQSVLKYQTWKDRYHHIYIYIYIERERETERETDRQRNGEWRARNRMIDRQGKK